nr:3' terminal RNA ribose 2'-O-methyltransferase Hen1 [Neorhizobium tomejilense]
MFLSLAVTGAHAPDLGYILYKHPDNVFEKESSKSRFTGVFAENGPERAEFCLIVEVDPVERVRGVNWDRGIASYVEPMPFLAASHLSHAISQALGSAMNGVVGSKNPETDARIKAAVASPWPLEIKVGPVRCGPRMIKYLFEEIGWSVDVETHTLDVPGREDDDRPLHVFTLKGNSSVSLALTQLYVLLPVLDPDRHYFYDESEVRKLFEKGGDWLAAHSYRDMIISRYLSKSKELREYARGLFVGFQEKKTDEELQAAYEEFAADHDFNDPERPSPHEQRHARIVSDLASWGARTVVDLGCGEGKLLERIAVLAPDMRVVGVEPSSRDLERARKRISRNPGKNADPRIELLHGSAVYADDRLTGFDAAVLSEVIEHVDPDRLSHLSRSVFGVMRPARVVVTTPNGDHNELFGLRPGEFRHVDHRFEWSTEECRAWIASVIAEHPYEAELTPAGGTFPNAEERHGEVSHYIVFTRKEA